jgi:dTDP-4-amino-4,6-dideoxy-D-galactose acyltransferase
MLEIIEKFFDCSKENSILGSKFSGIREIPYGNLCQIIKSDLLFEIQNPMVKIKNFNVKNYDHYFILKNLEWDSAFFERPMYKLITILFAHEIHKTLNDAVRHFRKEFVANTDKTAYCYIELPSEATNIIQSLTSNGFRLVESRIHQYLSNIQSFSHKRFDVRKATIKDAENLAVVAAKMRNKYDRFHADYNFSDELADRYLARFAEETTKNFADVVLVPNEIGILPNALLAVNFLKDEWAKLKRNVSQLVLASVDKNSCKGWYEKLLSEACYLLKENGTDYLITNTQTTNRAPIHVNEKLGFKYSHTTHILTFSNS